MKPKVPPGEPARCAGPAVSAGPRVAGPGAQRDPVQPRKGPFLWEVLGLGCAVPGLLGFPGGKHSGSFLPWWPRESAPPGQHTLGDAA